MIRRVTGHSMMPVLPPGTNVLAVKWFRRLKPGQVVIFEHQKKEKIKRIEEIKPHGRLWVLGDHLHSSTDSRHFGDIESTNVLAIVIWPKASRL